MARRVLSPYPGSRPFLRSDSRHFFGRAAEAAALARMWRDNRLTIASGPTASGKTSLLLAGVLPLVETGQADLLPPGRVSYGSTFPVAALPEHNPYTLALLRSWAPAVPATRLAALTIRDYLTRRAERYEGAVLAAIDQAELLLADSSGARTRDRYSFFADLASALADVPRLHLMLLTRQSAVDRLSDALGGGLRFQVEALRFESALHAVTGPAQASGRSFGPEAAEALVADLLRARSGTPERQPRHDEADQVQPALLQVVCSQLWESLHEGQDEIAAHEVRRYGDADAILAAHCGSVIAGVADTHDMPTRRLRTWLTGTFLTEHGTLGNAYEGMTDTAGMGNAVVRSLEDRHLLTTDWRSGSRWYELLSDRLVVPLRNAVDQPPPPVESADQLLTAERALDWGELGLAEHFASRALRTAPIEDLRFRAEAESLLGNLTCRLGKPVNAEAHYRTAAARFEAVRDTKGVARQLMAAGRMLLAQGRLADAVKELRAAADRLPNDSVTQIGLGGALWLLGQSGAAIAVFSGVLAHDGANADALRGRGEILAIVGQAPDALRDLDRVIHRDRPSVRAARALALAELGEHDVAVDEVEAVLTDAPRSGPVLLYAARAQALFGHQYEAAELAERAVNAADPPLTGHPLDLARQLAHEPGQDGDAA
jgi:tetratricopeptide (TPR) repeat protein